MVIGKVVRSVAFGVNAIALGLYLAERRLDPGTIGLIQATEVAKLILGIGEPLIGRLVTYDALAMQFRELKLGRDPACPMCGPEAPTTLDEIEYTDVGCAIRLPVPA